jgi:hypothetical protein
MTETTTDDTIFEEPAASDDIDFADDAGELVILNAANREDLLAPTARLFRFPPEKDKPRAGFYVRHATLNRVNRYQHAHKTGSTSQQLKAVCELVADSVVDAADEPVWSAAEIKTMAHSRVDRFLFMQQCVSQHNGMSDSSATMKEIVEEAEKNS